MRFEPSQSCCAEESRRADGVGRRAVVAKCDRVLPSRSLSLSSRLSRVGAFVLAPAQRAGSASCRPALLLPPFENGTSMERLVEADRLAKGRAPVRQSRRRRDPWARRARAGDGWLVVAEGGDGRGRRQPQPLRRRLPHRRRRPPERDARLLRGALVRRGARHASLLPPRPHLAHTSPAPRPYLARTSLAPRSRLAHTTSIPPRSSTGTRRSAAGCTTPSSTRTPSTSSRSRC
jgi:hypothetical protein